MRILCNNRVNTAELVPSGWRLKGIGRFGISVLKQVRNRGCDRLLPNSAYCVDRKGASYDFDI